MQKNSEWLSQRVRLTDTISFEVTTPKTYLVIQEAIAKGLQALHFHVLQILAFSAKLAFLSDGLTDKCNFY